MSKAFRPEDLVDASPDALIDFANADVPTLRQLHAIAELARRGSENENLRAAAIAAITSHLGNDSRTGSLPAGYFGAKKIREHGGDYWQSLLAALATAPSLERDDVLRWLDPGEQVVSSPLHSVADDTARDSTIEVTCEVELIFSDVITADAVAKAICAVLRRDIKVTLEVLPLAGSPAAVAMVELSVSAWRDLESRAAEFSQQLGMTVYWPAPENMAALGPDVRIAVAADGSRELVNARYTEAGYDIALFPG